MKILGLALLLIPFQIAAETYHHSEVAPPASLDPTQAGTDYANRVVTSVYDTLYEYKYLKRPYEIKPNLAASMPSVSKDGLTYTIKIRTDIVFADDQCFKNGKGRTLTADDVVYSINRHFEKSNNSQMKWMFDDIKSIEATDSTTVKISLEKPDPQILYALAHGASAVVPKEAVEKYGIEFGRHPVGSGPWMLKSFNSLKISLVKNPTYRTEKFDIYEHGYEEKAHSFTGIKKLHGKLLPVSDKIDISIQTQHSARWLSFTKGNEIQYTVLSPEQTENVLQNKAPVSLNKEYNAKYNFAPITDLSTVYFEFNMADQRFGYHPDPVQNGKNKALRCAVRKGFNWKVNTAKRYHGIGKPFEGVIPPGIDGFDPEMPAQSTVLDIAGAKKLLSDNGWNAKNLPELEYTSTNSVIQSQMYVQFQAWMQKIGYPKNKITYRRFANFADYWAEIKKGNLTFHGLAWNLDYPDAENILQVYYGPNAAPGANNANYKNPEYDRIFEKATAMQPGTERTELYKNLNQILIDDCVVIAGFARTQVHMWHKDVIMYPAPQVIGNIFKWVGVEGQQVASLDGGDGKDGDSKHTRSIQAAKKAGAEAAKVGLKAAKLGMKSAEEALKAVENAGREVAKK